MVVICSNSGDGGGGNIISCGNDINSGDGGGGNCGSSSGGWHAGGS